MSSQLLATSETASRPYCSNELLCYMIYSMENILFQICQINIRIEDIDPIKLWGIFFTCSPFFQAFVMFWPFSSTLLDTSLSVEKSHAIWAIICVISWGKIADCAHIFLQNNETSFQYSLTLYIKNCKIIWTKEGKETTKCNAEDISYYCVCYVVLWAKGHIFRLHNLDCETQILIFSLTKLKVKIKTYLFSKYI